MRPGLRNNTVTHLLDSLINKSTHSGYPIQTVIKASDIAYNRLSIKMRRVHWQILHALYGLKTGVTFNTVFVFGNAYIPVKDQDSCKSVYYALENLTTDNLITQYTGKRGYRYWMIAPAGLNILAEHEKKTLEIIQGWVKEAEELTHSEG